MKNRRLAGLFLLGGVLFNYPILSLFNLKVMLFGIPVLYLYIFSLWTLLILLIAVVTSKVRMKDEVHPSCFILQKDNQP